MRILVTGATGVIGRRVVPLLLAAGHRVTAVGRTPESRNTLTLAGASAVPLNLFDRDEVQRTLAGHDTVINLATHIPRSFAAMLRPGAWRENDRIRRDASRILSEVSIVLGIERFVQESFAPMYADAGESWIDETAPIQPARYNRSTVDAEAAAQRITRGGRTGVVLRFAGFYGPDSPLSLEVIQKVRNGKAPLPGAPDAYLSSVSHDDAASAVVVALDLQPGVYNVADDEPLRHRQYVDALAAALGVGPPKLPPGWMTLLGGSLARLMARSVRISNRKLRSASRWSPRHPSAREGWKATVEGIKTPGRPREVQRAG